MIVVILLRLRYVDGSKEAATRRLIGGSWCLSVFLFVLEDRAHVLWTMRRWPRPYNCPVCILALHHGEGGVAFRRIEVWCVCFDSAGINDMYCSSLMVPRCCSMDHSNHIPPHLTPACGSCMLHSHARLPSQPLRQGIRSLGCLRLYNFSNVRHVLDHYKPLESGSSSSHSLSSSLSTKVCQSS